MIRPKNLVSWACVGCEKRERSSHLTGVPVVCESSSDDNEDTDPKTGRENNRLLISFKLILGL